MKKRLNRLKFAVITVYFLILLLLIVGILLSPNPRYSFWSLATLVFFCPQIQDTAFGVWRPHFG